MLLRLLGRLLGGGGGVLFLRNRHFCLLLGLLGCWELGAFCFSEPVAVVTFGAAGGCLGGGRLFLKPVTFVTFGAAGLLGSWGSFVSQSPSLLSLLVLLGAAGELGALHFSEPVTVVTFDAAEGCWKTGGPLFLKPVTFVTVGAEAAGELAGALRTRCWWGAVRGLFVSQSPSLLSLLVWGAVGGLGAFCFSKTVIFGAADAAGGVAGSWRRCFVSQKPSLLSAAGAAGLLGAGGLLFFRTRSCCHFWCCWGLLGSSSLLSLLVLLGAAGELGVLCFSEPVTVVTFGAAGLLGNWGPFVCQNPSLLLVLVLGGCHFCHFWCC